MQEDNRLKELLRKNDISQQEYADWFCVSRDTAWSVINGRRQLEADEIIMICNRFNVTADWLLGLSDVEAPNKEAEMYRAIKELIREGG